MMRKACVEPISFNDDGIIDEVELTSQGAISIHIDQLWGKQIARINITSENKNNWQTISEKIDQVKGIHAVWIKFYGKENNLFELDWFRFAK